MKGRSSTKRLHFLIASGPTQEPLDPVRFISNQSTSVMGKHLFQAARSKGHVVTWVRCPEKARTAIELQKKMASLLPKNDVVIMAAAVCDVRPKHFSGNKIKKENLRSIPLVKNPDILASLKKKKKRHQVFIGFGLESSRIFENGFAKVVSKGLDLIVLQKVTKNSNPFGEKPVNVCLLDRGKKYKRFGPISKNRLSKILVRETEKLFKKKSSVDPRLMTNKKRD